MRAYIITDTEEDYAEVVFAESRNKARQMCRDTYDIPYIETKAKRAPKYDIYAEQGYVPAKVLLTDDWYLPCAECGETIYSSSVEDGLAAAPKDNERDVYCNACRPLAPNPFIERLKEIPQKLLDADSATIKEDLILQTQCDLRELETLLIRMSTRLAQLRLANAELNALIDLLHKAIYRGQTMWHDAHPDSHMIPDTGKLLAWMLDALKAEDIPAFIRDSLKE